MMSLFHYEDTAYDSTKPRDLPPPISRKQRSILSRGWLKRKLNPEPIACGEYLYLEDGESMKLLQAGALQDKADILPLEIYWVSFRNPLYWLGLLKIMGAFVAVPSSITWVFLLIISLPDIQAQARETLISWGLFTLGAAAVYYLLGYVMRLDIIPDEKYFVFDRLSGMVKVPLWGDKQREIPFDEFAPYQHTIPTMQGSVTYQLVLGHQYSNLHILSQDDCRSPWQLYMQWEYYRQFMDVSMPLPDVPSLELERALDPTTIEWDRKMGRPRDLWRKFPYDDWVELTTKSFKAGESFPWGRTRQEARDAGWSPSCYGRMTWWNGSTAKTKEKKKNRWKQCLK